MQEWIRHPSSANTLTTYESSVARVLKNRPLPTSALPKRTSCRMFQPGVRIWSRRVCTKALDPSPWLDTMEKLNHALRWRRLWMTWAWLVTETSRRKNSGCTSYMENNIKLPVNIINVFVSEMRFISEMCRAPTETCDVVGCHSIFWAVKANKPAKVQHQSKVMLADYLLNHSKL